MLYVRTLTALSLVLVFLFLCGSSSLMGQTDHVIGETGIGPTEIGYVEAAISGHSQPQRHGSIVVGIAALGEALPLSPECSAEGGCGYVTPVKPGFTFNSCDPPGDNFAFNLSGTFCQYPNGAWSFSGSFSVTSRNGSPAVGTGTVQAAAGENGQSIITLSGVIAQ